VVLLVAWKSLAEVGEGPPTVEGPLPDVRTASRRTVIARAAVSAVAVGLLLLATALLWRGPDLPRPEAAGNASAPAEAPADGTD
jgi:hypothetical protein